MPEWLKGADCKFAGESLHWFESSPAHIIANRFANVDKAKLFGEYAVARLRSSGVERSLGKGEVMSSNLIGGSDLLSQGEKPCGE